MSTTEVAVEGGTLEAEHIASLASCLCPRPPADGKEVLPPWNGRLHILLCRLVWPFWISSIKSVQCYTVTLFSFPVLPQKPIPNAVPRTSVHWLGTSVWCSEELGEQALSESRSRAPWLLGESETSSFCLFLGSRSPGLHGLAFVTFQMNATAQVKGRELLINEVKGFGLCRPAQGCSFPLRRQLQSRR